MSVRPQLVPIKVIPHPLGSPASSGDMSSDIISAPSIIQKLSMVSYSVSWTGTSPVGTITVETSDDYALNEAGQVQTAGTWNAIPLGLDGTSVVMAIPITGDSGHGIIDIQSIAAYAIRLVYTATSGTGSLIAIITSKVA